MGANPITWVVGMFVGLLIFIVEETFVGAVGHWALNAINATGGPYSGLMAACIVLVLVAGSIAALLKLFGKL
jgi:hypothetical protein